jgi:hypothetical protein
MAEHMQRFSFDALRLRRIERVSPKETKSLCRRLVRQYGTPELARLAIGGVSRDSFRVWLSGTVSMAVAMRRHILRDVLRRKTSGKIPRRLDNRGC